MRGQPGGERGLAVPGRCLPPLIAGRARAEAQHRFQLLLTAEEFRWGDGAGLRPVALGHPDVAGRGPDLLRRDVEPRPPQQFGAGAVGRAGPAVGAADGEGPCSLRAMVLHDDADDTAVGPHGRPRHALPGRSLRGGFGRRNPELQGVGTEIGQHGKVTPRVTGVACERSVGAPAHLEQREAHRAAGQHGVVVSWGTEAHRLHLPGERVRPWGEFEQGGIRPGGAEPARPCRSAPLVGPVRVEADGDLLRVPDHVRGREHQAGRHEISGPPQPGAARTSDDDFGDSVRPQVRHQCVSVPRQRPRRRSTPQPARRSSQ